MKHSRLALIALIMLSLVSVMGCYKVTVTVAKVMSPNLDHEVEPLEKEVASLEKQYADRIDAYKSNIEKHKSGADKSLEAGNLAASFMHIDALYKLTHPCGEEDCGTWPCKGDECRKSYRSINKLPPINKYEAYMDRERIKDERRFIMKAVDRLFDLSQEVEKKRTFNEADLLFAKYAPSIPGPDKNKKKFAARHKEIKQAWVNVLDKDANAVREEYPGAAMLMFAKASRLVEQQGKPDDAKKFSEQVRVLRVEALERYTYGVVIDSVSGTSANRIAKKLIGASYDGELIISNQGSGHASLDISTGEPSYNRSKERGSGSFEYQSGTKQVPNPNLRSAQEACTEAKQKYARDRDYCVKNNSHCFSNMEDDSIEKCDRVANMPQTIEKPVYSSESYPVLFNHLDISLPVETTISHKDGRRGLSSGQAKTRVTDSSHGSYSKGDGGVSADSEVPPSEADGRRAVESIAFAETKALVTKSFDSYRDSLIADVASDETEEINNLVAYILIQPDSVSNDVEQRLIEASGISDAPAVVNPE